MPVVLNGTTGITSPKIGVSDDGTATEPSFNFNSDSNTGIYRFGENQLSVVTDGAIRLFVATTAIQSTLPLTTQSVSLNTSGSSTAPALNFSSDGNSGMYLYGTDSVAITTGGSERIIIDNNSIKPVIPMRVQDGSAGAPSHSFVNDPNTGLFLAGADQIGMSTGAAERFRVAATAVRAFEPIWADAGVTFDSGTNSLDTYTEGTWTPSLNNAYGFTPGASPTYTGRYIRIGSLVVAFAKLGFNTSEAVAVNDRAILSGLPFLPSATTHDNIGPGGNIWVYSSISSGNNALGTAFVNDASGSEVGFVIHSVLGTAPLWNTIARLTVTYSVY